MKTSVETVIEKRSFDRRSSRSPKDDSVTGAILSISWKCSQHETWELGFKNWGLSHRTCLSSYRMIKKKQVAHQNSNNNTRFCCFSSQSCRVLPRNFTNRIQLINFIGWCAVFKISCSVAMHHAHSLRLSWSVMICQLKQSDL